MSVAANAKRREGALFFRRHDRFGGYGQPQHLTLGDFVLSGDRDLLASLDARRAAAVQLRGTKGGQHDELERIHAVGRFTML